MDTGMENVRVAVRARPLKEAEIKVGEKEVWSVGEGQLIDLEGRGRSFNYDEVFGAQATNSDVYSGFCQRVVVRALQGYNGTIFAYGQTSSGKTHSLLGSGDMDPGMIPRSIHEIFCWVEKHRSCEWIVKASYLEIYNENLLDLLLPVQEKSPPKLRIIEDRQSGVQVQGLTEHRVASERECMQLIASGEYRRSYGATAMNNHSSRSHTLFRMHIESKGAVAEGSLGSGDTSALMHDVAAEFLDAQSGLQADRASLYLVDQETEELYIYAGDITLRLPMSQGLAGAAASSRRLLNIEDAYEDSRFDRAVDKRTGYRTSSILCVPVITADNQVVGVAQFLNRKNSDGVVVPFSTQDEERANDLVRVLGPALAEARQSLGTSCSSRLNLVDLAGSERQKAAKTTGSALKEACHINSSLLMLGTVIHMLSEGKKQHVPFRNSKLTHILSSSLEGNTNTLMLCAISTASANYSETCSTLHFASRAKLIVNKVHKNAQKDPSALLATYEAELKKLRSQLEGSAPQEGRDEVASLRAQLEAARAEAAAAKAESAAAKAKLAAMRQKEKEKDVSLEAKHETKAMNVQHWVDENPEPSDMKLQDSYPVPTRRTCEPEIVSFSEHTIPAVSTSPKDQLPSRVSLGSSSTPNLLASIKARQYSSSGPPPPPQAPPPMVRTVTSSHFANGELAYTPMLSNRTFDENELRKRGEALLHWPINVNRDEPSASTVRGSASPRPPQQLLHSFSGGRRAEGHFACSPRPPFTQREVPPPHDQRARSPPPRQVSYQPSNVLNVVRFTSSPLVNALGVEAPGSLETSTLLRPPPQEPRHRSSSPANVTRHAHGPMCFAPAQRCASPGSHFPADGLVAVDSGAVVSAVHPLARSYAQLSRNASSPVVISQSAAVPTTAKPAPRAVHSAARGRRGRYALRLVWEEL
eukprot:TRINITY_DN1588_c0_g1_i1.p1 TRINITY_DN1588_c0_g1~~TRINITY_DN1588_c0_g1_i1.p1  ORF type:complete len:1032 (-),score=193.10 TRINITY_DN1588_c0_g1_i1:94-2871(-)